ncbi:MAG: hypothetical protein IIX16_00125 [Clostridia bacterium]|nr:hypothetical protein [Clostridia bacterium]
MIDGRNFSFGKYSLPKTNSLVNEKQDCTIGYFDLVDVKEVKPNVYYDSVLDQLLMGFLNQTHSEIDNIRGISKQSLFAFTNKSKQEFFSLDGYSFSEEKLNDFWEETNTFNRFFSLMHIDCSTKQEIYGVINWLNFVFNDSLSNKYKAVFYFTFDYSDIIVCAKNMSIEKFTEKLFYVNYCQSKEYSAENYSYCIRDSFSIISFNRVFLEDIFAIIRNNTNLKYKEIEQLIKNEIEKTDYQYAQEKLNIVYNIGVQKFELFDSFIEELSAIGMSFEKFAMLGRHDVTINKSDADIVWFIILLYYVDKYTTCFTSNPKEKDSLLFNCESFIRINIDFPKSFKVPFDSSSRSNEYKSSRYELARDFINLKIRRITNSNDNCWRNPISLVQKTSLFSLYKSIESTLKNGFADDFVICLYEPFVALLDYLEKKIFNYDVDNDEESLKEFDNVINRFFEIVTSLVNSAMHSDRQFIQTPSFNPVFFDVPPKLMAFYTVLTNKINRINGYNNDDHKYSFIFKPSLNRNISVFPYSYNQAPPTDRLLAVSINEESLYHPTKVLKVLCHEASHFVGKTKRCRPIRKDCWTKSVLFCSFELVLSYLTDIKYDKTLYSSIAKLIYQIFEVVKRDKNYIEHEGYSENINQVIHHIFKLIYINEDIDKILNAFFWDKYSNLNVFDLKNRFKKAILILDEFVPVNNQISIDTDLSYVKVFYSTYKTLLHVYKESYADMQMILILNLSLEDYIKNLVFHEQMNYNHFMNDIVYYKVFPVVYTLVELGIWKFPSDECLHEEGSQFNLIIEQIQKDIIAQYIQMPIKSDMSLCDEIVDLESIIKDFSDKKLKDVERTKNPYVTYSITRYLIEVVAETRKSFSDDEINKDRTDLIKLSKSIFDFEDSAEMFSSIQKANEEYLNDVINKSVKTNTN